MHTFTACYFVEKVRKTIPSLLTYYLNASFLLFTKTQVLIFDFILSPVFHFEMSSICIGRRKGTQPTTWRGCHQNLFLVHDPQKQQGKLKIVFFKRRNGDATMEPTIQHLSSTITSGPCSLLLFAQTSSRRRKKNSPPLWSPYVYTAILKQTPPFVSIDGVVGYIRVCNVARQSEMRLSVVCFFLPFFLGTRAMRCGSLLHVCLTLGVCLFITHLYFFLGGGLLFCLGIRAHLSVAKAKWGGLFRDATRHTAFFSKTFRRRLSDDNQICRCVAPTMHLLFLSLHQVFAFTLLCVRFSQCCVPILRTFFVLFSFFLIFLAANERNS